LNYYVARNGQTYGPYSEETIRKYMNEGSMLATDLGRTDAMPNWAPLGQILGPPAAAAAAAGAATPPPATPPSAYTPPAYTPPAYSAPPAYTAPSAYSAPAYSAPPYGGGAAANVPPSLHWAIILLIACFTSGLFLTIWAFIQANWIKSIDPLSKAVRDLAIGVVFPIIATVAMVVMFAASGLASGLAGGSMNNPSMAVLGSMASGFLIFMALCFGGLIFTLKAFFGMKASMERYYNTTEPINLRLSGIMTFFFNVLYFQYHMTRIADWKRTGALRP
jgi:GYF domain 2